MYLFRLSHILLCGLILLFFVTPVTAQDRNAAVQALPGPYQKWLDEDVGYIMTDEERTEFTKLETDQQRDRFITGFWERRNPNPGSEKNKAKEEHYRRLAYVNQHFAAKVPGWKTDRGRIYVIYGPPDEREQHPGLVGTGIPASAPLSMSYPSDIWRYNFIDGVGKNVIFGFIDTCLCGEFRLRDDPTKKQRYRENDQQKLFR